MFCVNARFLHGQVTGVQRYAREVLSRMPEAEIITTSRPISGLAGHGWEQLVLPFKTNGRLLWSPCNSGPLMVRRQVVTIHDVTPIDHPEWMGKRFAAWYRYMIPRLADKVIRVLTDSEFSRSRILAATKVDEDKVVAIPLAVDPRFTIAPPDEVETVASRFGLEPGRYLLGVSSIEPRKNIPRLLMAWSDISMDVPTDIRLVLAGSMGPAAVFGGFGIDDVPERVQFIGYVPDEDLPALYTGALGFVYLSLYEGFGLPPLEAMACGTPVLSSNAASLPEVVEGAALVVNPTDQDEIARGLKRFLADGDLRADLRSKGLRRAAKFSWEDTAARTRQVLLEAAQ